MLPPALSSLKNWLEKKESGEQSPYEVQLVNELSFLDRSPEVSDSIERGQLVPSPMIVAGPRRCRHCGR